MDHWLSALAGVQQASPATSEEPRASPSTCVLQHMAFKRAWGESKWWQEASHPPPPRPPWVSQQVHSCPLPLFPVPPAHLVLSPSVGGMRSFLSGPHAHL